MTGSQREDYILRQIRAVAAMLARIAGLRMGGMTEEARAELDQAYRLLSGPDAEILRGVDARTAALILASPDRILAFARLAKEEAEQERDAGRRALLEERAAALAREAARRDPDSEEIRRFLETL